MDPEPTASTSEPWHLRLFISTNSAHCAAALRDVEQLVAQHLPVGSQLEVIDILKNPAAAKLDSVVAIPALVRKSPGPTRQVVGEAINLRQLLPLFDLSPRSLT